MLFVQQLYKDVTAILNKLTPQNFQILIEKFKSLQISRVDELQGVVYLIFEKASIHKLMFRNERGYFFIDMTFVILHLLVGNSRIYVL